VRAWTGKRRRLGEKRELVDDDGHGATRSDAHELADGLIPPGHAERHRFVAVTGESLTELP